MLLAAAPLNFIQFSSLLCRLPSFDVDLLLLTFMNFITVPEELGLAKCRHFLNFAKFPNIMQKNSKIDSLGRYICWRVNNMHSYVDGNPSTVVVHVATSERKPSM